MAESPISVSLIHKRISCKNAGHNKMEPIGFDENDWGDCNRQVDDIIILESCQVSDYEHTRLKLCLRS